jgi:diaphanous 1
VAHNETFRFEELVQSLKPDDDGMRPTREDIEEGIWEARTASLALVNTITNCPESLEQRITLREEFGRRGINEALVVRIV